MYQNIHTCVYIHHDTHYPADAWIQFDNGLINSVYDSYL